MMDCYLKLCTMFLPSPLNGYVATCTFIENFIEKSQIFLKL